MRANFAGDCSFGTAIQVSKRKKGSDEEDREGRESNLCTCDMPSPIDP